MQDRYVGDIGDFVKYALLRAVFQGFTVGVAWYLNPNESSSKDGRHTDYLARPGEWRHLDEDLFDELKRMVESRRSVAAVQASGVLPRAVFADERLDVGDIAIASRTPWRSAWFERVRKRLENCEVVFADPDNGVVADVSFRPTWKRSAKSIPQHEIRGLSYRRPMVVYHHNSRRKGGHRKEIAEWQNSLPGRIYAYHWRRWSNRTFFFLNCDSKVVDRLKTFAERWMGHGDLILPL